MGSSKSKVIPDFSKPVLYKYRDSIQFITEEVIFIARIHPSHISIKIERLADSFLPELKLKAALCLVAGIISKQFLKTIVKNRDPVVAKYMTSARSSYIHLDFIHIEKGTETYDFIKDHFFRRKDEEYEGGVLYENMFMYSKYTPDDIIYNDNKARKCRDRASEFYPDGSITIIDKSNEYIAEHEENFSEI